MPGPAHLVYGLGVGLILMYFSNYKFSSRFVIIFTINCWLGPDFGAIIWATTYHISTNWSELCLLLFHNPYTFPIVWAPLLAFIWSKLSRLDIRKISGKNKVVKDPSLGLLLQQCYLLVVAGGFSHFFLDYLFDAAGHGRTFLWVINTGYWEEEAYYDFSVIIVILLVAALIIGYFWINNEANTNSNIVKLKKTIFLFLLFILFYELFLGIRLRMGEAALGEEADFGVIIFISGFIFLPLLLCALALELEKVRISKLRTPKTI